MTNPAAIEIHAVTKRFDSLYAVKNVSSSVKQGELYALIGENGAGKTTLIKMMTGLIHPTRGHISLFGHSLHFHPEQTKQTFGYISDNPSVYDFLSGREFLAFTGQLRNMKKKEIQHRIEEMLPLFSLHDLIDQPMSNYSRGSRQKVAFLSAIISQPKLLIIDEPIVGLDPDSIESFGRALKDYTKNGGTVFLATHILSFAKQWATRVGIMHKGALTHEGTIHPETDLEELYHLPIIHP